MTTIDIAAAPALRIATPAPTRLRLTVRGRRVLAVLASLPAVVALVLAILSGGSAIASHDAGAPAGTFSTVTVVPGDTLWSLAAVIAPEADPRDVVDGIISLNALPTGEIVPGQELSIPLEYAPGH